VQSLIRKAGRSCKKRRASSPGRHHTAAGRKIESRRKTENVWRGERQQLKRGFEGEVSQRIGRRAGKVAQKPWVEKKAERKAGGRTQKERSPGARKMSTRDL